MTLAALLDLGGGEVILVLALALILLGAARVILVVYEFSR